MFISRYNLHVSLTNTAVFIWYSATTGYQVLPSVISYKMFCLYPQPSVLEALRFFFLVFFWKGWSKEQMTHPNQQLLRGSTTQLKGISKECKFKFFLIWFSPRCMVFFFNFICFVRCRSWQCPVPHALSKKFCLGRICPHRLQKDYQHILSLSA